MIAETAQPLTGSVLNWVDLLCIALIGAMLVYGVVRGFMIQLFGILVLVGSAIVASLTYRGVAGWVLGQWPDLSDQSARGIGFTVVFVLLLAAGTGLAYLLRSQMAKAKMLAHDRLLGALLGLAKGWLLAVILLQLVLNLTMPEKAEIRPEGLAKAIVGSRSAAVARWSTERILVFLPQGVAERLREYDRLHPAEEETPPAGEGGQPSGPEAGREGRGRGEQGREEWSPASSSSTTNPSSGNSSGTR